MSRLMVSRRGTACLAFLESCEGLCTETDGLRRRIEDTQSALALELLAWHELLDDIDGLTVDLMKFAAGFNRGLFSSDY